VGGGGGGGGVVVGSGGLFSVFIVDLPSLSMWRATNSDAG